MTILLIGGAGNISSACVAQWVEESHTVTVLNRTPHPLPSGVDAIHCDRNDLAAMRQALKGRPFDVVVNFLGFEPKQVEADFALFRGTIGRYVFISSCTVYDKPHRTIPLTEDSPLGNPFSPYARNKQACEEWLGRVAHADDFPVTIVRPSHTYSPRWFPNVISSAGFTFAARLLAGKPVVVPNDGQGLWTLTAAADFAQALGGLMIHPEAAGKTFHVTSDEVLTWNQIYRETARALGIADPVIVPKPIDALCRAVPELDASLRGDKAEPGIFDTAAIKRLLPDFQCRIPFHDGIRQSVAWYREHPACQVIDPAVNRRFEAALSA